jgi:hypothetical protein
MAFNLNDDIVVELTDEGEQRLWSHAASFHDEGKSFKSDAEKDAAIWRTSTSIGVPVDGGRRKFHLYEFMHVFGQVIHMGGPQMIVDNRLEFADRPEADLDPSTPESSPKV